MKKSNLVLGLMVSTVFMFGDEFKGYEENHSFLEPVDMVQTVIDGRKNFADVASFSTNKVLAKKNFNMLKNTNSIDAHRADTKAMVCAYESRSKNIIRAFFEKHKSRWYLKNIDNSKHQKLNKKMRKSYELHESENCFYSFMDSFEQAYPNTELRLIGREAKVEGILFKKKGKVFDAHFNLNYLSLNKHQKSGWYLSKIELKASKKKEVKNKKVASNKRGFLLRDVVPALPNARLVRTKDRRGVILETNPLPNLKNMVCSNHQNNGFIRMVFTLDREKHIRKAFEGDKFNHKLIRYAVNSKNAKIVKGNCSFLQVNREYRLELDLRNFPNKIVDVKYGDSKNHTKSYLDLYY